MYQRTSLFGKMLYQIILLDLERPVPAKGFLQIDIDPKMAFNHYLENYYNRFCLHLSIQFVAIDLKHIKFGSSD
jgi:hypothetical protein